MALHVKPNAGSITETTLQTYLPITYFIASTFGSLALIVQKYIKAETVKI